MRYPVRIMIGSLRGTVLEVHSDFFLLEVQGVGYRVRAHSGQLAALQSGGLALMYIHEHIREDAHELFGFATYDELTTFELLLGVQGVGPKVGLAVCGSGKPDELRARVAKGDVDWLSSLPGIGKKTAQKIVLELKGQLVEPTGESQADAEVATALTNLGYSSFQAKDAIKCLSAEIVEPEARIRAALKILMK